MFLIHDELLERLICSQCKKYLSVKPIKIYPNRHIRCGRCSTDTDAGVLSKFGILAEDALFKCINRYEGCSKLLTYSEVAEHEKNCSNSLYICHQCTSYEGSVYNLLMHYKEKHGELTLNGPQFIIEIDKEYETNYLYKQKDTVVYVNIRYSRSDHTLWLNINYVGPKTGASQIQQSFVLHSLDDVAKHKTVSKRCSYFDCNLEAFQINICEEDFPKKVIVCTFTLDVEERQNLLLLSDSVSRKDKLATVQGKFNFQPASLEDKIPFGQITSGVPQEQLKQSINDSLPNLKPGPFKFCKADTTTFGNTGVYNPPVFGGSQAGTTTFGNTGVYNPPVFGGSQAGTTTFGNTGVYNPPVGPQAGTTTFGNPSISNPAAKNSLSGYSYKKKI